MPRRNKRRRNIKTPPKASQVTASKREPREEGPTLFQLIRRAEAIGETVIVDPQTNKPTISGKNTGQAASSALSLLSYKGKITPAQYRAGQKYAALRRALFGPATAKASALREIIHEHLSSENASRDVLLPEEQLEREIEMRIDYQRGDNALRKILYARRVRDMVRMVCVDDMMPQHNRPKQLERLREGLQCLADTWRTEK